jgi:regulator of protease activity HflC (stomatin/prohibitin superfamily)
LVVVIPFIERVVWVDIREQFLAIPHQTCITQDNAPIDIDFLIYTRVVDPMASVVNVQNYAGAAQGVATTTLRAVIGDIPLDDALAKREQINHVLQAKLDEITGRWGVKVNAVEIREINPPREIQASMNRQMSAERERRAMVTEADGRRQATVTVAEGDKQSAILRAEGEKQSAILGAEGHRQAQALEAEGYALALDRIFRSAQKVDANTMTLQYFDALKALGASPSTKYIFPLEFTGMLRGVLGALGAAGAGSAAGRG